MPEAEDARGLIGACVDDGVGEVGLVRGVLDGDVLKVVVEGGVEGRGGGGGDVGGAGVAMAG